MKKLLIILFLLGLSKSLFSQHHTSEKTLKNALKSIKKNDGGSSLTYIRKLIELSQFYNHSKDYQNALKQISIADKLISKKITQLKYQYNARLSNPSTIYTLGIKTLITQTKIYNNINYNTLAKHLLHDAAWIDEALRSTDLKLVETILSELFLNFNLEFQSPFFQKKWNIACASQVEVPKELRFLKHIEQAIPSNHHEYSNKQKDIIINLAIFYKKNQFVTELDSILPVVEAIAADTISKIDINTDRLPRFPGCEVKEMSIQEKKRCADQKFLKFIYSNIQYPEKAYKQKMSGIVFIKFTVTATGKIINTSITKDIGGGCGEEVLRVINLMNDLPNPWIGGTKDNQPVQVEYELPIHFDYSNMYE
ncbi:energy transducer TonB [Aureispira sp. CCB-QB1]|uniref:energy transducer TonB n=1 Tax=Aureispira sp. CCB-QB1 TaxID=1313421 RepID=UPI0006968F4A|nr:energy transducer TonB [Aureispira sp. CCB-QB1]